MRRLILSFIFYFIIGMCVSIAVTKIYSNKIKDKVTIEEFKSLEDKFNKKISLLNKVFQTNVKGKPIYSLPVTATGYSARKEECDANPEITASGTPSRVGVIAVSRDLEKEIGLTMGQMVLIEGIGLFRIEDRMNQRWKRRIDILHGNPKAAMLFGKKNVKLTWIGRG